MYLISSQVFNQKELSIYLGLERDQMPNQWKIYNPLNKIWNPGNAVFLHPSCSLSFPPSLTSSLRFEIQKFAKEKYFRVKS